MLLLVMVSVVVVVLEGGSDVVLLVEFCLLLSRIDSDRVGRPLLSP